MTDPKTLAVTDRDDDASFAEGTITLYGNLLTLIGTHLRDTGMPRDEVLAMLTMLHHTNEETSVRRQRAPARHAI